MQLNLIIFCSFFFQSLTRLDLSYNRLVQLDAGAFSSFRRLSNLDLSHNSQLVLERDGKSFQGIEDTLSYLYLDNVSLTYVINFLFVLVKFS